jgi:hypothetical protein
VTISLQYLDDLSRVRIALSDLPDGMVRVQRALNASATDPLWTTVRGGESLEVIGGVATLDDYEFHADVENYYRVVPIDPAAGLLLTGDDGDYANTPDTAALDITGDIDIRADLTLDNWLSATPERWIVTKYEGSGNQRSFAFGFRQDDLEFRWSTNGTSANLTTINPTAPVPVSAGRLAVRVTLDVNDGAGGWTARFYTAPTIDGPWSQLGDPVTNSGGGTTSIHAGTATLAIGAFNTGTVPLDGIVHSVEVRDGIDGTVVANPDFAAQPHGTTQFTDGTGKVWTVHGNARIFGVDIDSITPSLNGRVWLKSVRFPLLNQPVSVSDYSVVTRPSRDQVFPIVGRSAPVAVTDLRGVREWTIDLKTDTEAGERKLELALMAGDVLFLHVPTTTGNALLPGSMHAVAGEVTKVRVGGVSDVHIFRVPLVEVAPPAPDVVGTTLTWGTVRRLFGSWEALMAAHPDWAQLLAVVGDPEDLVVI